MLQQGTPQQNRKFSLANINVCSTQSSELFVPQFDTQTTIYNTKIYIPGGPVHNIGHICNIGQHMKDTDLFRLVLFHMGLPLIRGV